MWDLPRPGLEPVSPALAGRFSTTAPPGKPHIPFYVYVPHLLTHSSFDGHLGSFHVLAVVNSAAVNIGVHVHFELEFSPDICPGVGLLGHMVVLFLVS